MVDPSTSLAFSIHASRGVYAFLLGSGVSRAASIPTGWEVVQDLCRRLAHLKRDDPGEDAAKWYEAKLGVEPDYSKLLEALAPTPAERVSILRGYFERGEDDEQGLKQPTRAHHAVASLVASGHVRVILTTNFDRLMEGALQAVGVSPVVIASAESAHGALPLAHVSCCVIKVHGDYLDTRLRNTATELETYEPGMNRLLDQVFDEYGLVVVGWSADWDPALRAAIDRCPNRRFTTYWASRSEPSDAAKALIARRSALVVRISDADTFLSDIAEKRRALGGLDEVQHPLAPAIAVQRLKRYMKEQDRIAAHDLVMEHALQAMSRLSPERFPAGGKIDPETVGQRLRAYEATCSSLLPMCVSGAYWGGAEKHALWRKVLELVAASETMEGGTVLWLNLRRYPVLLLIYGIGLAAWAAKDFSMVRILLRDLNKPGTDDDPLVERVCTWETLEPNAQKTLLRGFERRHTPLSDYLHSLLRPMFRQIEPDESSYDMLFDRWEYAIALDRSAAGAEFMPLGRFVWRSRRGGPSVVLEMRKEAEREAEWAPLVAGLFGGTAVAFKTAETAVLQAMARLPIF